MPKLRWGGFIILMCTSTLLAEQRRALEGFQGQGMSTAEAVTDAKSQCFEWASKFSVEHFLLGTPDCGSCLCTYSPSPKCLCFGSIRYEDKLECAGTTRPRTIYHSADGSALHCGEAKFDAAIQLYDWQATETANKYVVEFRKPECYCRETTSTQASATCRASVTYAECTPPPQQVN